MKNKKILIGVCGGIAVYKACGLINYLKKERAEIKVIMTEAATKFVTPLTFQTISSNPVYTDMFKIIDYKEVEHISLAKWCDIMVVAPVTANTIAKIANGIADNLLTSVVLVLSKKTPVLLAPAMNTNMWNNKFTVENVKKIKQAKQYKIIGPGSGKLVCGDEGEGVLIEIKEISEAIKSLI